MEREDTEYFALLGIQLTLFSDVHTPFNLMLKIEHPYCEDAHAGIISN
jgi:hypothetical protein